jgi:hypothetical protein
METSDPTRYDNLMVAEKKAILNNRTAAVLPQPVDYDRRSSRSLSQLRARMDRKPALTFTGAQF